MSEAQKLVDTIRNMIRTGTRNGAQLQYHEGYVHDGSSSYYVSAYLDGDETTLIEGIVPLSGAYLGAGDYIQVVTNESGYSWINRVKETTLYSKIVFDTNRGRVLIGDGNSPPSDPGSVGQVLQSGGPDSPVSWGSAYGGSGYYDGYGTYDG